MRDQSPGDSYRELVIVRQYRGAQPEGLENFEAISKC